jgi:hypothetical protein
MIYQHRRFGHVKPEPIELVIGPLERVPLTREGYEVIRSVYGSGNIRTHKIIRKVFHGKGPSLWRVPLRYPNGNNYTWVDVRARTSNAAIKKIEANPAYKIIGKVKI